MQKITKEKALSIANHCANVYKKSYKPDSTKNIVLFEEENSNGYYFEDLDVVYIFIAGTDDFKDTKADMKFISKKIKGESFFTRTHTGFYNSYKKIKSDIMKAADQNKPIVISGHSLGGAIAIIAAYELSKLGKDVTCVTFGSPRVGGYLFTRKFNKLVKKSYRFVNKNDMVTRMPNIALFYHHVDTELQSKGKKFFSYFGSPKDHLMEEYKKSLKNNMWSLK